VFKEGETFLIVVNLVRRKSSFVRSFSYSSSVNRILCHHVFSRNLMAKR